MIVSRKSPKSTKNRRESMETQKKIRQALRRAGQLEKAIKEIIRDTDDYDVARLLKKVDAECMDAQHNLVLAERRSAAVSQKKKKEAKAKRKSR
jgi:hypothetical protein